MHYRQHICGSIGDILVFIAYANIFDAPLSVIFVVFQSGLRDVKTRKFLPKI